MIMEKKEFFMDVMILDKKYEEEILDVLKFIKEEIIFEVFLIKEIIEVEFLEYEILMYLYVYGVRLFIFFLCVINGYMVFWLLYMYIYIDCRINCFLGN